jgi:hypothetical protein
MGAVTSFLLYRDAACLTWSNGRWASQILAITTAQSGDLKNCTAGNDGICARLDRSSNAFVILSAVNSVAFTAVSLSAQASFAEEIVSSQNRDHRFLTLLGDHGHLDFSRLNVEYRIRGVSLPIDNLSFPAFGNGSSPFTFARNVWGRTGAYFCVSWQAPLVAMGKACAKVRHIAVDAGARGIAHHVLPRRREQKNAQLPTPQEMRLRRPMTGQSGARFWAGSLCSRDHSALCRQISHCFRGGVVANRNGPCG